MLQWSGIAKNAALAAITECIIMERYQEEAVRAISDLVKTNSALAKGTPKTPFGEGAAKCLADFLALAERDLERALAMAERAISLEQGNSTYLDTYAWILYRLGRYDEAKKAMQQALSLDRSESPTLQFHYGDILAARGEYFMAEIYWRKALEGGYENPDAIIERFQRIKQARTSVSPTPEEP